MLKAANNFLWGAPMIILLLGVHLFFTFKLKFVQKHIFQSIKLTFTSDKSSSTSSFATLATALAATLGTGNIVGVSTAVALGGPGAIFWCWLTGLLGMATSYAECYLSFLYRIPSTSSYLGGPMYVLEYGLHNKCLAIIFSLLTVLASFGVGCTTQSNSIINSLNSLAPLPDYLCHIIGILVALLVGMIVIGGFNSISSLCMKLVPSMAIFYTLGCFIILYIHHQYILDAIILILRCAFSSKSFISGLTGYSISKAIRYGVSRGLFTNEAGLGSTPITSSIADNQPIHKQSLISMSATFLDTVVMCAITGITIITSLLASHTSTNSFSPLTPSVDLVSEAFRDIPYIGNTFLTISLITFAFATLIGWFTFGEHAYKYLFPTKNTKPYQLLYIVMIYLGAVLSLDIVWEICDLFNALMAIPNILALLLLCRHIKPYSSH